MPSDEPCEGADSPGQHQRLITPRVCLVGLVVAGLSIIGLFPHVLVLLGLPDYGHWFLDSYAILAANDAVRAGLDPYAANPLDALMRPHVYSDWWLVLGRLGLTREHNFYFGGICVLGFLGIAWGANKPRSYTEALGLALLLLSPPMLLAINRANNDLIIFILLGVGLMVQKSDHGGWARAGLGLMLVLSTGLKYYPFVGVVAFALIGRPLRPWFRAGLVTALAAVIVLWLERTGIGRAAFRLPVSLHVFGSSALWRNFGMDGKWIIPVSMLLLMAFAVVFIRYGWTKGLSDEAPQSFRARLAFAMGALLLMGCFLAGSSYAYRWIFALWLWPWLLMQSRVRSRGARWAIVLLNLSVWSDGVYCFLSNIGWLTLSPIGEIYYMQSVQAVHWMLMALLAGWLGDAFLSAWRTFRQSIRE